VIAVLVGVVLVIAGVVSAHVALNAQTRGETGAVDRGVVDVTTTLGLSSPLDSAAGTGIVLTSKGEILTNNHVIRGATSIVVTDVNTGRNYTAFVVGYDESADVAVLQLQSASGLTVAKIGDSSTISIGSSVQAVGNVGGVGGTPNVADGTIIGLDRSITATDSFDQTSEQLNGMIETNANIRPGDSGGPLENAGQVIGIDTAGSDGFAIESGTTAGFAIPIDEAMAIAGQIQAGRGSATVHIGATAYIGVGLREQLAGATVEQVEAGSPAAAAGLVKGDVITSLDGNLVNTPDDLAGLLVPDHPGQAVTLGFLDPTGQSRSVTLHLATGPAE
jgi:S1-C subfamily serine protease